MLVTTSIIESGIDIPTANTLIVERADLLGLAQLYQIRGRIGRSDAYAYAYLLYPSEDLLTGDAAARLRTLSRLHRAGLGLQDRHARPRDPRRRQPARRRAVGPGRGRRLRDVRPDARGGRRRAARRAAPRRSRRCASTCRSPPTCRPSTSPTRPPRSTPTGASRGRATSGELGDVRAELADRFGAPPEPVENLLTLQSITTEGGGARRDRRRLSRQPPAGRRPATSTTSGPRRVRAAGERVHVLQAEEHADRPQA